MKFKKGDILEFKGVKNYSAKKGAKAICTYCGNNYVYVEWIRNGLDNDQDNGGYHPFWFTKVEEVSTQGENRILKENKKVMKFDFEKGKQQLLEWMDNEFDCTYGYSLQYIKELSTIAEVQDEVESFRRFEESWVGKTAAVNRATTMREIFKALEDTAIEDDDNFIIELFTTEQ
jgi:AAA+ ATPase superfamily predicted ATPase